MRLRIRRVARPEIFTPNYAAEMCFLAKPVDIKATLVEGRKIEAEALRVLKFSPRKLSSSIWVRFRQLPKTFFNECEGIVSVLGKYLVFNHKSGQKK